MPDFEDKIPISEFSYTNTLHNTDQAPIIQQDGADWDNFRTSMADIGLHINKDMEYVTDLHTTSKKIIGAINELADGGSAIDITTEIDTPAAIQTFSDGGDNIPLKSCEVNIPVDAQGFSSVNIGINGKNFYPIKVGLDLFADNRSASHTTNTDVLSITMDAQNNSGVYGGTGAVANNTICQTMKKFSGKFVLSLYAKASADNKDVYFGFLSFYNTVATLTTSWQRVEVPMILDGIIHTLNFYNRSGSAITVDIKDVQIESGTTATPYKAFAGDTYSISLGETLTQGGTLEAVSGLLTRTDTTTSQLTGTNIESLSGINNVYADVGDINEIEYFNEKADDIARLIELITR